MADACDGVCDDIRRMRHLLTACFFVVPVSAAFSAVALEVPATIRDFKEEHPDFEGDTGTDHEIVARDLGADGTPAYAGGDDGTDTTAGPDEFAQWYHDVDGVNRSLTVFLPLTEEADGRLTFESDAFFPIDNRGFGNEGNEHNYHFTTEVHLRFTYRGGETFEFDGDDDVYVFINHRKALDLGGVHGEQSGDVDLDDAAGDLGLVVGQTYDLDLFHAERHLVDSNFKLTTSIALVVDDGDDDGVPDGTEGEGEGSGDDDDEPIEDDNGDGVPDDQQDLPGDGFNDLPDDNGDGVPDGCTFNIEGGGVQCDPGLFPDGDEDGVPDAIDDDRDGDGVDNAADDDQDGDGVADVDDDDIDGDGVANDDDNDIDGDGVRNADDDSEAGAFASDADVGDDSGGPRLQPFDNEGEGCGGCAGTDAAVTLPFFLLGLLRLRRSKRN